MGSNPAPRPAPFPLSPLLFPWGRQRWFPADTHLSTPKACISLCFFRHLCIFPAPLCWFCTKAQRGSKCRASMLPAAALYPWRGEWQQTRTSASSTPGGMILGVSHVVLLRGHRCKGAPVPINSSFVAFLPSRDWRPIFLTWASWACLPSQPCAPGFEPRLLPRKLP